MNTIELSNGHIINVQVLLVKLYRLSKALKEHGVDISIFPSTFRGAPNSSYYSTELESNDMILSIKNDHIYLLKDKNITPIFGQGHYVHNIIKTCKDKEGFSLLGIKMN